MSAGFLFDNLPWKLLSLAIAVVLWFAIVDEPDLVTSQSVPILYKSLPPDLEIGSDVPDRVHLELRGPASRLSANSLTETSVLLDLSGVHPGEQTFTISSTNIRLQPGVTFLRSVPSQLRLRFDHMVSKDVAVQVRFAGPPPVGYTIVSKQVLPARLRIVGAENRVQLIESAQTDPIDISGVVSEKEFHVHAYVADPQIRFESQPGVSVRVRLQQTGPQP